MGLKISHLRTFGAQSFFLSFQKNRDLKIPKHLKNVPFTPHSLTSYKSFDTLIVRKIFSSPKITSISSFPEPGNRAPHTFRFARSVAHAQDPLECLSKLRVEDGVDEGVDAGVDVAEPGGEDEGRVAGHPAEVELEADGVEHVAGEEGHPAEQEAAWKEKRDREEVTQ